MKEQASQKEKRQNKTLRSLFKPKEENAEIIQENRRLVDKIVAVKPKIGTKS